MIGLVLAAVAALGSAPDAALLARGEAIAVQRCGGCHAVGPSDESLRRSAPPFRTLGRDYPVADTIQALAEGARPTHPAMPPFRLGLGDAQALAAYVRSVQAR